MPIELERRSCKASYDYCHEELEEISALVINKLLMDIRSAKLNYSLFKKGLDAFKRVDRVLCHPQDDSAVAQELSAVETLIKEFQEEYRSKMSIFKDRTHLDAQMTEMNRRLVLSKHVLVNGSEDLRSKVIHIWEGAYSEAEAAWAVYGPMEDRVENCYNETKAEMQRLSAIQERVARNQSGYHTDRDMEQLVDVGWKLLSIRGIGSRYLLNINGEKLGKANDGIRKLMAEMTSLCKQVDDERKAKMNTNIKQLQKDKRSETHVKYEVYVKVDDAEFQADVCVRNGQQPKFCAAKSRPFEPPIGMRDTGSSRWTPPTLEVQLGTTNNPQRVVLKDLKASSPYINGSFSEKDIPIKLPQQNGRAFRTKVKRPGTFGPNTGNHTVKVTCIRKGTENCTGFVCKEPGQTHWIDSGTQRS
ncbi:hypothetical protein ACEPAH_6352 [Sanghuangporus vaninii]